MPRKGPTRDPVTPRCPACHSPDVVPVVFGLPAPELMKEADDGNVVLGGCVVSDTDPRWHCKVCSREW